MTLINKLRLLWHCLKNRNATWKCYVKDGHTWYLPR